MKKLGLILLTLILLLCLTPLTALAAKKYVITQLTDNDYADYGPQIDAGQVAWYGYDGTVQFSYLAYAYQFVHQQV